MSKSFRLYSGVILAGVVSFANMSGAQTKSMSDAEVEANVLRAFASAPELATQSIKTTTVYGIVTLSGSVSDEPARVLAETLASRALGVQKVVDEMSLAGSISVGTVNTTQPPAATSGPAENQQDANQGSTPLLQSDGTMASPGDRSNQQSQQPAYPQQANKNGTIDPRYGPAGAPPDMQGSQPATGQAEGAAGAPPIYRQPYRGAPISRYGEQPPPVQYGAQEGGRPVTIPSGALVRMRLVEGLTAKLIKAGTVFDGTVLNDVIADGEVAIPRGAAVQGTIVESHPSGAVGGKGQLALQLTSVSLSGKNYPIVSDTWTHYGRDKSGQTIGNAVGLGGFGALIGALAGGGTGAVIGAAAGVGAGVGTSAAAGRHDVVVPAEAIISFHLTQPAGVVTVPQSEMDRLGYGVQQANLQRRPAPAQGYYGVPNYSPTPY